MCMKRQRYGVIQNPNIILIKNNLDDGINAISPDKHRPISLTIELYKINTRILVIRLKPLMGKLIGLMQSVFIPLRAIANNILLAQELLHNFHHKSGVSRMYIKLDLAKAYDSVQWEFLKVALHAMNFPEHMISLIMMCVSEHPFYILVNGQRQGCPLSPYLFTIVTEFFLRFDEQVCGIYDDSFSIY
ncbi:hypothetical protein AAC387_Pa04g1016 [Persea americana]